MKKTGIFKSFLLLLTVGLVACSCSDTPTPPGPGPEPDPVIEEPKLEKTKLNYTYTDVCNNYYKTTSAIPNSGEPELLIIPVYFSDSNQFIPVDKKATVKADIEKAFFGTKEEVGFESVTSYYSTLSVGKCNLKGKVADWIDVDDSYNDYAYREEKTMRLVKELTDTYFTNSGENRSKYDLDKDGYLDGVVVIYAAPDSENLNNGGMTFSNLWAYTYWLEDKPNVESPVPCNFFWASYDFLYSKTKAKSLFGNTYGSGDGGNDKLIIDTHVFIHETGHMFGLQDYYDYSYQYSPAGGFSMQDYNVASHDPFSVMALGWADPYIPTESCTITLNKFQSSRECIILTNTWNNINSPFAEYLLLEFYSPDGLNQFDHETAYFSMNRNKKRPVGPDDCGIRLWHVDARLLANPYTKDPGKITVDPNAEGKVAHVMSNTYYSRDNGAGYVSLLGVNYANYNILQLIRNEETQTYQTKDAFDKFSLFKNGSKFTMNLFGKQFVNRARLNSNKVLGWSFTVEITGEQAKIALTRTI